jgi:two-component system, OmpR family, sensor histidine kinase KdpD
MRLQQLRIYTAMVLAVIVVTACALSVRDLLTLANFTMFYMLLVVIVAISSDTKTAFAAVFLSFMCINFFLVPPFYSLWVADPREVIDLCVFLIVAAIAGRLGAQARQQTQEARERAHEQEILYRLTRSFNQLTHNEGVHKALARVLQDDLGAQQADILPHASGTAVVADSTTHFLLLMAGSHIYGTVRVVFDSRPTISQEKLLNTCVSQAAMALQRIDLAERARKSAQFEEADRLKTAILHAVSHDLRTPITIIKTSASNLQRLHDQLAVEEKLIIAETIENEVDQLDKLVGNLLDMSRLQAGALRLDCQLNSLEEIAGDVAARVWQLTKQERIKLVFPDDMPLVNFDYGLLLQAVTNLVDNALRYEPPDSQVEIRGDIETDTALLKVVNHGITISPDVKAHMMEPFYHGKEGRTGLGLPIAKGILDAHVGQLWVEDTPGSGATFVIALPFNKDDTHETQDLDR